MSDSSNRQTDRALVLSRVPYGESDFVLGLLCRNQGMASAVARSARSSRRRFQGLLDFFVVFDAGLAHGRGGLPSLVSAEPVRFYPGIMEDLDRLETGLALIQAVRDVFRDAPATPAAFDTVELAFACLDKAEPGLAHMVLLEWALSMAAELGHMPEDGVCPGCGERGRAFVVSPDGRILCTDRCQPPGRGLLPCPPEYAVRRPLEDNPAIAPACWKPDRELSRVIVSALVAGITGFSRPSCSGED